ncbi:MAG: glycoside hydrolase family 15 protein [Candidatus Margulisbacteria bacterium]|nr:glycoside hydrolase family 15 protein [Candidatus Margulisiibacteriota bacterium]
MYNYGLIGNCNISALVSTYGSLDWLCLPRPDSPPVFGSILDPDGGSFTVDANEVVETSQQYILNTNILETVVTLGDGSQYKITDFCPRFNQYGRIYRPLSFFRIVTPISGTPRISIKCSPVNGWDKQPAERIRGNSHIYFAIRGEQLRLTSNMPMTYLIESKPYYLRETLYFALTWGHGLEDDLARVSVSFLEQTRHYWLMWVKQTSIPTLFQEQTIRSALALKLHCFEDTGAILASVTTSLPEEIGGQRNWDYRYCWLRDAYFTITAFRSLGHYEEMEGFLKYFLDIAQSNDILSPVYKLDQTLPLPEFSHDNWSGYQNSIPVRSNNEAANQIQNDVYGEMMLVLTPIFFDERFHHLRTKDHLSLIRKLVNSIEINLDKPDAGIWELRNNKQVHTFSLLMSWAGLSRLYRIQQSVGDISLKIDAKLEYIIEQIRKTVHQGVVYNSARDRSLDASLLLFPILGYPDKELCRTTVYAIEKELKFSRTKENPYLYRYQRIDDFGKPSSAFLICSFWLIQALEIIGDHERAVQYMQEVIKSGNHLQLYSEHYNPDMHNQIGNFPQAYSHVGLINSAFAVSPQWGTIF